MGTQKKIADFMENSVTMQLSEVRDNHRRIGEKLAGDIEVRAACTALIDLFTGTVI